MTTLGHHCTLLTVWFVFAHTTVLHSAPTSCMKVPNFVPEKISDDQRTGIRCYFDFADFNEVVISSRHRLLYYHAENILCGR